ncbi:MAG: ribonuclease P protein component [Magnetococcales bacterium]|nr:ribonuclease P protein component [Magnetococcales bacterium]
MQTGPALSNQEPSSAPQQAVREGSADWDRGLPKSARLLDSADFRLVTSTGRRLSGRFFLLFRLSAAAPRSRVGLTVSRKVGKAVVRNHIKRLVREYFRHHRAAMECGGRPPLDIVVIARPQAGQAAPEALVQDLQKLFSSFAPSP